MLVFLILLLLVYGLIALAFFILSATELLETDRSSPLRLAIAAMTAIVWPVTVVIMTTVVSLMRFLMANRMPGGEFDAGQPHTSNVTVLKRFP